MSDTKTDARASAATVAPVQVVISGEQHAQRELARELADMRAEGRQMDKTEPGGRYIGPDGRARNAHGVLLDTDAARAAAKDPEDAIDRLRALDEERAQLQAIVQQQQATAQAEAQRAAEAGTVDEPDDERAGTTRGRKR